ncbi:MAG TPA: NYN domain-containing protein [Thermoanaerobaculia bacterium]|nr:NYN domain-containing protein [Thermoanaerobaculia bacterium]
MAEDDLRGQHVAVLLDFENLIIAFKQRGGDAARKVRSEPIVDFLEDNFGNVIFRRAYADWAHPDFTHHQKELQALGVEMIHVPRRTRASKKNGADILLTADAVESLLLRPFIDTFAVVSGDSDIGPLVTKLKAHGKTVVVIGPDRRSTARHVIELADRFKYYDDIVSPPEEASKRKRARRPLTPQRAVVSLLRKANGERIESADLKRRLLSMPKFKDFQEKALGFKTWTSFLNSIDEVEVHRRSDLGVEVSLRER